jgi:uncharacterized protein (TIGR02118 family)
MTQRVVGTLTSVPEGFPGRVDVVHGDNPIRAIGWADPDVDLDQFADAWLVDEQVRWDGATPGRPVTGVKQVTFLRRAAAMTHDQFVEHWTTRHVPLARAHHPALWRYRQNIVIKPLLADTPDFDGIAELGMRLRLDFRERMYDSDEGRRIVGEDVRRFLDIPAGRMFWTREYSDVV